MKKFNFMICFFVLAGLLYPDTANAFKIKDALTKAADVVEETIEVLKLADEKVSSKVTTQRDKKIGEFGESALGPYKKILESLKQNRKLAPLDIPTFMAGAVNDIDKADEVMQKEYTTSFGSGGDMTKAKSLQRKQMEVQHNNIASVYAKAYTIRFYLKDARLKPEPQVNTTNSREMLQAQRVYVEQTNRRLLDMLTMEMALLEFESTEVINDSDNKRKDVANITEEYNE